MPRRDRQVALVEMKTAARVQDFMPFWYSRSLAHRPCTWFLAILAGCLVLSALVIPLGTQIRIDTEMDGFENRDHYASKREAGRRGASARIIDSDYELPGDGGVAATHGASALEAGQVPPATYTVPGWFVSLIYVHDESGGNLLTAETLQAIHEFEVRAYHSYVFQKRGWRDVYTRANTNGHDGSVMTPTPFSSAMQYLYPSYLNASESWREAGEHGCCNSDQRGVCPWHYQGNDTSLASLEDCPSPGAALCCPKCSHCADCMRCPLVPLRGKDGVSDGTSILFDGLGRSYTGASYRVGPEGVQRALSYIVRGDRPGDAQWFFGKDFDKLSLRTSSLRTEVAFGCPLPGFAWYGSAGQEDKVRGDVLDFVRELERDFNVPGVRLVCGGDIVTEAQLIESLKDDTFLAAASLAVVFVYMVCYLHSVVLGLLAVLQVLLTIPVSLFWYAVVFREGYLGALNVLSLYVMLGIAVDDIFIFSNAFFYSEKPEQMFTTDGDVPLEQRLAYALRKSGVPMLVTTTTSATAFFANLVSSIPAVRAFGALMGVLVIMNYVLVMTLFPAILAMYFKYTPCCRAGRGRAYAAGSAAEQEPTKHLRVSGWGVGGCPVYTQPSFDSLEAGCLCDGDAVTVTVRGRCAGTAATLHRVVEGGPPGYVTLQPRATVAHTLPFSARVFLERPVSTPLTAPVISYLCTDAPHERPACLPKVPTGTLPAGATVQLYADEFDYWTSSGFHKLCEQPGYIFLEEKVRPNVPFQRRYVLEGWGALGCPAFVEPHLSSKVAEFLPNGSVVVEATDYLRAGTAPRSPTDPMVDCFLKVRRDGERQTYCVTTACAAMASGRFERSLADACEQPNILKQPAAEKPADNHEDGAAVTAAPSTLLQEVEWGQLRWDHRRSDDGGQRAAVFEVVGWGEEGCPEYAARSTDGAVVRRHCDGDVVPCALEEGHDLRTCAFLLTSQGGHIQVRSAIGAGGLVQRLSLAPAAARRRSVCKPVAQPPRYRSQRSLARCSFRQPTPIQLLGVSTFGAPVYAEPSANARVTSCVHSGDTVEVVCSADDKGFLRVTSGGFVKKDPDLQFRRVERDTRAKQPFGNPLDGFASSAASPSDASAEVLDAAAGLLLPRLAKRHMVMNLSASDNACGLPLHPQLIYNEMRKRGLRGDGDVVEDPDLGFFAIDFDDAEHSGRDVLERVFNGDVVHITDAFVDARKEGLGPERVHRCVKVQYRGVSGEEDEATRYVPVGDLTPAEFPASLCERFLPVFLLTGATPDAGIPVFSDPHFVHSTIVHVLHRRDVLVAEPNDHGTDTFVRVMLPLQGSRAGYVYCEDLRQEGVGLLGGRRRSSAPSMAEAAQHVKVPRGADPGCAEYGRASESSKVVRVHPPNAVIEVVAFPKAKVGGGGGNAGQQFVKTTEGGFVRADRVVRLPRLPRTLSELRQDTYPAYEVTAWGDRGCPVYKSPRSGSATTEVLFDGERVEALGTANGFVGLRQGGYARLKEQAHGGGGGGARSGRLKPVVAEGCQAQTTQTIEEGWDDFMSQSLSEAIIRCTSDITVEVPSDEEERHAGYETDSEAASDLSNPAQATDKTEGTDSVTSVLAPHLNGDNFRLGSEPIPQGDGATEESDDDCIMPGYSKPWLRRVFDVHVFPALYAQRFVLLAVFTFVTVAFIMAVSRLTHQDSPPSFFRSNHPVYIYRNKNAIFSTAGTCAQKFSVGCGAMFHERAPRVVGCDGIVYSGAEVDACGVCQGSGSTCPGCDGVLGSNKAANACGMCGLPSSACPPPGTPSGETPGPAATPQPMPPPVAALVVPVRVSLRVTCGEHAFKRGFDNVKRLKLELIYDLRAMLGSRDIESVAVGTLTVADDGCAHAAAPTRGGSVLSAAGQYLIQVRFQLYSHVRYPRSLLEDTVQGKPFTASARYLEEHRFGTVSEVLVMRQPTPAPESPQPLRTVAPANTTDQPPGTLQPASETPDETLAPPRGSDATSPPDAEAPLVDTAVPLTSTPATDVPVTDAPTSVAPLETDTGSPETGVPTLIPSTPLPHTSVLPTESPVTTSPDTSIPVALPLTFAPLTGSPTDAPTTPVPETPSDASGTSVPPTDAPQGDNSTVTPETEMPSLVPETAKFTAGPTDQTTMPTTDAPASQAPASRAPNEDADVPSTAASPTFLPATQIPVSVPTDLPVVTTGVPDTSAPPADTTAVPADETAKPVSQPFEPSRAPTAAPTMLPVVNLPLTEVPLTSTPATDVPVTDAPTSVAPLETDTGSPETGVPTLIPSTPLPHTSVPPTEAPVTTSPDTSIPVALPLTSAPLSGTPLQSSSPVTASPPTSSSLSTQPETDAPMTPFPETPSDAPDTNVPTPAPTNELPPPPTDAPYVDDATPEPPPVSSGAPATETPATAQPSASTGVPGPVSGSDGPTPVPALHSTSPLGATVLTAVLRLTANCYVYKALSEEAKAQVHGVLIADVESSLMRTDGVEAVVKVESVTCGSLVISLSMTGEGLLRDSVFRSLPAAAFFSRAEILTTLQTAVLAILRVDVYDGVVRVTEVPSPQEPELACRDAAFFRSACGKEEQAVRVIKGYEQGCQDVASWMVQCTGNTTCDTDTGRCVCDGYLTGPSCAECSDECVNAGGSCDASGACVMCNGESGASLGPLTHWVDSCGTCGYVDLCFWYYCVSTS